MTLSVPRVDSYMDAQRSENIALVEQKYAQAIADDYLGLLDATDKTPEPIVRKRYIELVKLFHPDNLKRNGMEEGKAKAAIVFKKLAEALEVLTTPDKREVYLAQGQDGQEGPSGVKGTDEDAKIAMHQSKMLLRSRAFDEAIKLLKQYVTFVPDDPEGYQLLGWAHFQNPATQGSGGMEKAVECWQKALSLNPENAETHYYLSLYYKASGDKKLQGKHLRKVLSHNPRHVGGLREQRLAEMREKKAEGNVQSMDDWFKVFFGKLKKMFGSKS